MILGRLQIQIICRQDFVLFRFQRGRHGFQRRVFLLRSQSGNGILCRFCGEKQFIHTCTSFFARNRVPTAPPSRMVYRWFGSFPLAMTISQPQFMQISAA